MTAAIVEDVMSYDKWVNELKKQEQAYKEPYYQQEPPEYPSWKPTPYKYDYYFWMYFSFALIILSAGFLLYIILAVIGIVGCL